MKKSILQLIIPVLLGTGACFAQNAGDLDNTFGASGYVYTDGVVGTGERFYDMVTLDDDKIIVAGFSQGANTDVLLYKYHSDGSLDSTFGLNGRAKIDVSIGGDESARAITITSDGKILVAGMIEGVGVDDGFVMRLNSDGTIDNSFGTGGTGVTRFNAGSNTYCLAKDITLIGQSIVVGAFLQGPASYDMAVFKLTQGGGMDVSFGTNGGVVIDVAADYDRLEAVDVMSDGRIVFGGYAVDGGTDKGVVGLLKSNGDIDSSFAGDGLFTFDEGNGTNKVMDVLCSADDRVWVAGHEGTGQDINGIVIRLSTLGTYDNTFSGDGKVISDAGASNAVYLNNLALQEDNRVLATGHITGATLNDAYAFMMEESGSPVSDFGTGGDVNIPMSITVTDIESYGMALQSDGKIVMSGFVTSQDFVGKNLFMIRLGNHNYTGIEDEFGSSESVNLYPNPATQYFQLDMPAGEEVEFIQMISMTGQIVYTYSTATNYYTVPSNVPNGSYVLFIQTEQGKYIKRLTVSK